MKTFTALIFLFSSLIVNAQTTGRAAPLQKDSKFYLGWNYTPEISYRFLSEGSDANASIAETIKQRNANELKQYSQSGNIFVGYVLSDRFSIEAGIGYSSFGHAEQPDDIIAFEWEPGYDKVIGFKQNYNRLHVVSIPVNFRTYFWNKRVRPFIAAGASLGMVLQYVRSKRYVYDSGTKHKWQEYDGKEQFSTFHLIGQISTGVDIHVSNNVRLRVAPRFQITTNSIYAAKEIRGNYYNVGIEFGAVCKL